MKIDDNNKRGIERFFGCNKKRSNLVPDAYFWDFCNTFLPQKKFSITDIDMILRNSRNQMMIIEKKCKMKEPSAAQSITYQMLHGLIMQANKSGPIHLPKFIMDKWTYYGYHLLQFENTSFDDGKVYFDHREVTQDELVKIMSFDSDILKVWAKDN